MFKNKELLLTATYQQAFDKNALILSSLTSLKGKWRDSW